MKSLGAILLAAGSSSRLGQSKQLLQVDGQPLVRLQATKLLALNPACVVVVTGAEQAAVERALQGLPLHGSSLQCVHNSNWQQGMGGSLACGVAAMPERVRGALLMLCDQWKVSVADLQILTESWERSPATAVIAQWQEELPEGPAHTTSGPPVVFPRTLFSSLVKLHGERGAQQILKRYKAGVQRMDLPNAGFDIDQPSDLPWAASNHSPILRSSSD